MLALLHTFRVLLKEVVNVSLPQTTTSKSFAWLFCAFRLCVCVCVILSLWTKTKRFDGPRKKEALPYWKRIWCFYRDDDTISRCALPYRKVITAKPSTLSFWIGILCEKSINFYKCIYIFVDRIGEFISFFSSLLLVLLVPPSILMLSSVRFFFFFPSFFLSCSVTRKRATETKKIPKHQIKDEWCTFITFELIAAVF